ncbi:hypothetical protein HXA31_04685 [Salipaludibacillus agaradhaerens]|uniref:Uncharacterized protein n=1 Tax=Salipaludibacillus agaradhaerens TaxID=76935 RepID=A0A9Q4B1V6_SALAG|nr:hypothetical protein [Salipaludibacillus agaradhaerens]MCR6096789.1 hypothetical protein [Salipaludibacillus agaradhaerens]MCR6113652.1 hypothetical protein [Salipaludibacillus agaradhaerens]
MSKHLYYVTWHTGSYVELLPVKVDQRTVQYEVEADDEELKHLEKLITTINNKDVMEEHIFVRPFDEDEDEKDKLALKKDVKDLFQVIYNLGTEKTKRYLDEL